MSNKQLARAALLLALALALQSLRLVLPLPQPLSTFVIGTLVHLMLLVTLKLNGLHTAILLGLLLPMSAYLQGQLPLVFLVPVVWIGNLLFIMLVHWLSGRRAIVLLLPPLAKALVMLLSLSLALNFLKLPPSAPAHLLYFAMTVPQFVTAVCGILLARQLLLRIRRIW